MDNKAPREPVKFGAVDPRRRSVDDKPLRDPPRIGAAEKKRGRGAAATPGGKRQETAAGAIKALGDPATAEAAAKRPPDPGPTRTPEQAIPLGPVDIEQFSKNIARMVEEGGK